jgi:hypothetical protein
VKERLDALHEGRGAGGLGPDPEHLCAKACSKGGVASGGKGEGGEDKGLGAAKLMERCSDGVEDQKEEEAL